MNNNNLESKECTGRISAVAKNVFFIRCSDEEIPAKLKGIFYENDLEFPVVGDYVDFLYNPMGESVILSVKDRKNVLKRPDQAKTGVMQCMVANVDYCFIVTALNEDYSYNRIARYASIAYQGATEPVVILTKSDLCNNVGRYVREVMTISEDIRVHAVSAIYDIGLDELNEYFVPGKTICLMGSSGAGKSTLINHFAGEEVMKTGEIRESDDTGKHTTTRRQLLVLKNGVSVIDTPGMREVGMAQVDEGLDNTFSDILELEAQCRFSDCKHDTEPGCAVKRAVEEGRLSPERLELFRNLGRENVRNYAKKKAIAKMVRQREKNKEIW